MKGSVATKKDSNGKSKYYIVVDLPREKDSPRKQKWSKSYTRKRDAEHDLPEFVLKHTRPSYTRSRDITLAKLTEDYLVLNEEILAKSTMKRYKSCIKKINEELGTYKVQQLEPYMIEDYFKLLRQDKLKSSTIAKHKTVLHQVFSYAIEMQLIVHSPVPKIKVKNKDKALHETWSSTQLNEFLMHIKGEPIYIPVLIAGTTGMRLGEVVALKWKDINLAKGTITIKKSMDIDNTLKAPKNNASRRPVHLMKSVIRELEAHKFNQKKNKIKLGKDYQTSDFVCTLKNGKPMNTNYVTKTFPRKVIQHNFSPIRFHDLRHTFATISLSDGIHPKVIQEILGHSSIRTTLDTYSHVIPSVHQESMELIEKAFSIN